MDYNWLQRPQRQWPQPNNNEKLHYKKFRTTNKIPMMEFQKSKQEILQKLCLSTLIPESNTNQEEPIIHFTNTLITIENKTIPKTTISQKHNKPWFIEDCKKHKRMSSNSQEIQDKPLIRKSKQIQTTKGKNLVYHQRS